VKKTPGRRGRPPKVRPDANATNDEKPEESNEVDASGNSTNDNGESGSDEKGSSELQNDKPVTENKHDVAETNNTDKAADANGTGDEKPAAPVEKKVDAIPKTAAELKSDHSQPAEIPKVINSESTPAVTASE
jgi:hypothetical protein